MSQEIPFRSMRARKARLARRIAGGGLPFIATAGLLSLLAALYCFVTGTQVRAGYLAASLASLTALLLLWYRYGLRHIPGNRSQALLEDILEQQLLARLPEKISPRAAWEIVIKTREGRFIANRLLLDAKLIAPCLSEDEADMAVVWERARALAGMQQSGELHAGVLAVALLLTSTTLAPVLTAAKLTPDDILDCLAWLDRQLSLLYKPRPRYGGIGRDWAVGFTPTLERFGENISHSLEMGGGLAYYQLHTDLVPSIASSLAGGSGVALIGPEGVGKTTLALGLADHLLEGREPRLQYYQIINLNASLILSNNTQLEAIMLTLFSEASRAGNIIIFLDDAHLFFSSGVGAFDMSQVLMPILRSHNIRLIAAFTPSEWQQLQAKQSALASSFSTIAVPEPDQAATMRATEDIALSIEHHGKAFISYDAIREAYRLSGQFMQEYAYPGKAIRLLEQSVPYATADGLLTAETVQAALEKARGVRVASAQAPEADMLLHLEDRIHERMINQKQAVNVVAAALRRGRAGVTNPKRPLGSFLFLGPTGVGKTELARSLAAVYFSDEKQMIRLDMSEYQRPEDVSRLLDGGDQQTKSLLLAIREQPFAVVLLDEIEKAHPSILNLLLQMLDEGQLTDTQGRPASFRSCVIIATSNAGAADITAQVREGKSLDDFERPLLDKLIASGQFKPELVNRFDEVVLFRPLTEDELAQVAAVMLREVNATLAPKHISVSLTPEALKTIVHAGYDPEFGARPMRRIIQRTVENAVAIRILEGKAEAGSNITLDIADVTLTKA